MEENKNIWKNFDTEKISRKNIRLSFLKIKICYFINLLKKSTRQEYRVGYMIYNE